ncbi:Poly-beta-1,6-N-acetyl-D-glucosamine synthase [Acaryochloris thomasi RCC1774]|uniref:Poly-beta-1,6-N-acetyl-D-glucosamine synthase n=1 Tax=Acaryochloris thomasi RCC1774 TaxID=1764569 RepID=A0A2W1JNF0_9CYAN|nr:glycosyltransferase family A protein [Acaryochloris thomasi]PZD72432.1 Poly-beta-1,6-N-acetyl-D-glucosamine synthase [Acaryochloris thomasi RCC1774]
MSHTLSVIITCYSEGDLLHEAVQSVISQSKTPLEIIVVNDSSTDPETIKACRTLDANPLVTVINRHENGGTSAARNDGVQAATGDICLMLDGDDLLPPEALSTVQNVFDQHPAAGFIFGDYLRQDNPQQPAQCITPGQPILSYQLKARPLSLSSNWTLLGTSPIKRKLWQSVGGYDLNFGVQDLHDVEFWVRVLATGCSYAYAPQPIYLWRKYFGSNSRQVTPLAWYRLAESHFDIYCASGLEYRANELLLLGSKWMYQTEKIQYYGGALFQNIRQGQYQFSSFLALMIPAGVLQLFSEYKRRNR